jgi:hypothetical protein
MTHAKLAAKVNEYISLLPVHTIIFVVIFDHAAEEESRVLRKYLSRLLSSLAIAMCVKDILAGVSCQERTRGVEKVETYLLTKILKGRIYLLLAMLVPIHEEIQHIDRLDHTTEGRHVALGRRDIIPAGLAGHPKLNTAILRLAIGVMSDIVDNDTFRSRFGIENWTRKAANVSNMLMNR